MSFLCVLFAACLLDLLFGDPRWLPHPVRLIGWFAARMEQFTRRLPISEWSSGGLTVALVLLATGCACAAPLLAAAHFSRLALLVCAALLLWTTLAARDLISHAMQVHVALGESLAVARQRVAMLVGRDTAQLDAPGVIRACIESVAENMSDGITAPLFWAFVGALIALPAGGDYPAAGAALAAMLYKAVSTMDSMFGYKNERYLRFGWHPARLDDLANFLPARISGFAIALSAPLAGGSLSGAWRVLLRDRRNHASPNSGWPEAAAAGALGVQLGGEASYFGKITRKPLIGDPLRAPAAAQIVMACRLAIAAALLCLCGFTAIFLAAAVQ
ncbi:adenosylcobinamide-phosphate synthase CbiB [Candidatus Electronema sp. JC]|uniref:adenosylcobinamide-phosphate synthase CbiB n=1 Tax=Candidatus Electronema sp. JC TaxID=3401570 RepID=UPI003AA93D87